VCIHPIGVMAFTSGMTGAEAALTEGFLTLAGGAGATLGADGGLFSVAIGVKLEGRQKWR